MFKTLSGLTDNAFWRVQHQKSMSFWCGTIRAVLRKTTACWRFMFACWQTYGYFNVITNNVNKKMAKKALFFGQPETVEGNAIERIEQMILRENLALLTGVEMVLGWKFKNVLLR